MLRARPVFLAGVLFAVSGSAMSSMTRSTFFGSQPLPAAARTSRSTSSTVLPPAHHYMDLEPIVAEAETLDPLAGKVGSRGAEHAA